MSPPTAAPDPLDALVPPPWDGRRRTVGVIAAVAAMIALFVLGLSGVLGPQLRHGSSWGSGTQDLGDAIEADRIVPVHNAGWLPVEVIRFAPPSSDAVTWTSVDSLPATLGPGETIEVTVRFRTDGCQVDVDGFDSFPFVARSGVLPPRRVEVRPTSPSVPPAEFDGIDTAAGLDRTQAGSWIVDAIDPACLDRAGLIGG